MIEDGRPSRLRVRRYGGISTISGDSRPSGRKTMRETFRGNIGLLSGPSQQVSRGLYMAERTLSLEHCSDDHRLVGATVSGVENIGRTKGRIPRHWCW